MVFAFFSPLGGDVSAVGGTEGVIVGYILL